MDLQPFQWEYNGLVFGDGLPVEVVEVDGIEGFEARVGDRELPRSDGDAPGAHYVGAKLVAFRLEVMGDPDVVQAAVDEVRAAFAARREGDLPLRFRLPGQPTRRIMCRPVRAGRPLTQQATLQANPVVTLRAADPRVYADDERHVVVRPFADLPASDFPLNFPQSWPAGGGGGDVVAHHGDVGEALPLIRVHGPAPSGFTLFNRTTGRQITVGAAIATGQILTVDMAALETASPGLVVAINGASRYGDWAHPRETFSLPPGDNLLRLTAASAGATTLATVTYRDTSMT